MRHPHDTVPVLLFAAATTWGAVVSVREQVVGEPLHIHLPGSVVRHAASGWGAGLTWGRRAHSRTVASAVGFNMVAAAALVRAGRQHRTAPVGRAR